MTKPPMDIPTTVKNKDLVERRRRQIILAAIKLSGRRFQSRSAGFGRPGQ